MKDCLRVTKCPSYKDYNVFGVDNKGCCYSYHDYCKNIEFCPIKEMLYTYGNEGIEKILGIEWDEK